MPESEPMTGLTHHTSFGKFRRLQQASTAQGAFMVLALDHRANLIAEMNKARSTTDADVIAFKTDVLRHLADLASAVLIDPDYGFPGVIAGAVPGSIGLLAPLEVTDYTPHPSQRGIRFIPGWSLRQLQQVGCCGAKLLIYYHPDAPDAASKTAEVDQIIAQCHLDQIPLFLEPILYSMDPTHPLDSLERLQLATATARHFSHRGVDVLKLEFPVNTAEEPDEVIWTAALQELNAACAVPWTLLSAGVPFEVFLRQAKLACEAGASGVIAGRAIWAEAVTRNGADRVHFLQTTARDRLRQLNDVCRDHAASWQAKTPFPELQTAWYNGHA